MVRTPLLALLLAGAPLAASPAPAAAQATAPSSDHIPHAPAAPPPPTTPAEPQAGEVHLPPLLVHGRDRGKLPAVAAAIVRPDGSVNHAVLGARKLGERDVVRLDDPWHLGSCGKAMTATLVALLIDQGKLSWETTLAEAFPELAPSMAEGYRAVTIEQLLQGRGRIPAAFPAPVWDAIMAFDGPPREARRMIAREILTAPQPISADGYVYSNVAWVLAGAAAEEAADADFEGLMRSMLFEPLGMKTAGFGAPGLAVPDGMALDAPRGHHASGIPQEPGPRADNPPALAPTGTMHASIEDWGKFVAMQLRGLTAKPSMLKHDTWARMMNPPPGQDAAMGWMVRERTWADGPALTHDGSNTMWFSVAWVAPRKEFAVLVTTNTGGPDVGRACNQLAWDVIQEHLFVTEGREKTASGR